VKNFMSMLKFENTSALDAALTAKISDLLKAAIAAEGKASLVVSGGRTPVGFFHLLSQCQLDWSKVTVALADERWVNADHAASNEKLVRENLLINEAFSAEYLALKNTAENAVDGEAECQQRLNAVGRFTVVILGMGDDGHTASLFPGSDALERGLDMHSGADCIAVTPLDAPHERMSMTLPRLLNAESLVIHISGASKQQVLTQANAGNDVMELPIRAILQQQITPVSIYWAQ
jgi:6-phosphogluconolactonase